jgi:hypothetical protein
MESLNEKSKSKSQQRLMGMVYAYKDGKLDLDDLPVSLSSKIKGIADGKRKKTGDKRKNTQGISKKEAEKYASTKHKGLPEKIEEHMITKFNDFMNESTLPFNDYIHKELSLLFRGSIYDKTNSIDNRIEQLISMHSKWLEIAKKHYSAEEIAKKLYQYDKNLNK